MSSVFEIGNDLDRGAHLQSFMARQSLARAWAEFQVTYPLILAPVSTLPPVAVGADLTPDGVAHLIQAMRMVVAVNLLGLPSASVPVGIDEGLPQAVQIIGPRYREDLCLDAAEALEQACGVFTPIDPR
jgi:amidase